MEEEPVSEKVKRVLTNSQQILSRGLWIVGTVSLAVLYPLALGVLEERFIKRGKAQ